MNDIERRSAASTIALVLYLLLIYGLAGQLDCADEQRARRVETVSAKSKSPCKLASELPSSEGTRTDATWLVQTTQANDEAVPNCESISP